MQTLFIVPSLRNISCRKLICAAVWCCLMGSSQFIGAPCSAAGPMAGQGAGIWDTDSENSLNDLYPVDRRIAWSFTLENQTGNTVDNAEFRTYAPVGQTPTQLCKRIISSHDYELIRDSLGNQILCFSLALIPPYGSRIISIAAELGLSTTPHPIQAEPMERFLQPEPYIESDHALIQKTAAALKNSVKSETIQTIFRWVADNLTYDGYTSRDRGALFALKNRRGDCTESMYLFAALCRANGIPARCLGGYVCPGNTVLKPAFYHNWAQVHDGDVWQTADPQRKVLFGQGTAHIAMRIIDNTETKPEKNFNRFYFKGKGLAVRMNP